MMEYWWFYIASMFVTSVVYCELSPRQPPQQQQCIINKGKCTYRIELVENCKAYTKSNDNGIRIQSDNAKITVAEHSLVGVQKEHSKMISNLENRRTQLSDPYKGLPTNNNSKHVGETSHKITATSQSNKANMPKKTKRHENSLMKELQGQFVQLRQELYNTKKTLKNTEKSLRLSQRQYVKTKVRLDDTNRFLNKTQLLLEDNKNKLIKVNVKLKRCEEENAALVDTVNKKGIKINSLRDELKERDDIIILRNNNISELSADIVEQKRSLKKCQVGTEEVILSLEKQKTKIFELIQQYGNLTEQFNNVQADVIKCTDETTLISKDLFTTEFKLNTCHNDLQTAHDEISDRDTTLNKLSLKFDNLKEELNSTHIHFAKCLKENNVLSTDLFAMEEKMKTCHNDLLGANAEISKKNTSLNDLRVDFENLTGELNSTHSDLAKCLKDKKVLGNDIKRKKFKIKTCESDLEDVKIKLKNKINDYEVLTVEFENKSNELNTSSIQLTHCTQDSLSLVSDIENKRKEITQCRQNVKNVKTDLESETARCDNLDRHLNNMTDLLNETTIQLIERGKVGMYCGFEDPRLCGYTQSDTDNLDWLHWSFTTPSAFTGPKGDHTCGNDRGHYMYVEATAIGKGDSAQLISPQYRAFEEQCVEFYYNMYGKDVGTLNVYLLVKGWGTGNNFPPPVWRAYGNQGAVWSMARLEVPVEAAKIGYQVVFEVMTDGGYAGDIALDDVRIFDGQCYGHTKSLEEWRIDGRNKVIDTIRIERKKLQLKKKQL